MSRLSVCLLLAGLSAACSTRIQTTHYIGVFDPQQQVAQELYRVSIEGHSKPFSKVEYGSGWVPAGVADLLVSDVRHDSSGKITLTGTADSSIGVSTHRRFFEIGPLGVSTEPQNGRFVIVMSSNPDYFFQKAGVLTRYGADPDAPEQARRAALDQVRLERMRAQDAIDRLSAQIARESAHGE